METNKHWDNVKIVKPSNSIEDKWLSIIYENQTLRNELDSYLEIDRGAKIQAIKCYRNWCLGMSTISFDALFVDQPDWSKKEVTLRICKDTIDVYANRLNISKKMEHLRETIEIFCNANGYDKMDNYKVRKAKGSHQDVWVYSDWEFVDDMYGNMINSQDWMPAAKTFKDMNEIYKKYKKLTKKGNNYVRQDNNNKYN
jgi:hypothetical protein